MKLLFCLSAALLLVTSVPAFADTKIGIIDTRKILEDSDAGKTLAAQLKSRQDAVQAEATAFEKKLKSEQDEILAKRKDMKESEFDSRRKAFEQEFATSRQTVLSKSLDLDNTRKKALADLQAGLAKAATEVAKSKQLDIILDRQLIVVAQEGMDVTADVLKKLNETVKTVSLGSAKK